MIGGLLRGSFRLTHQGNDKIRSTAGKRRVPQLTNLHSAILPISGIGVLADRLIEGGEGGLRKANTINRLHQYSNPPT